MLSMADREPSQYLQSIYLIINDQYTHYLSATNYKVSEKRWLYLRGEMAGVGESGRIKGNRAPFYFYFIFPKLIIIHFSILDNAFQYIYSNRLK